MIIQGQGENTRFPFLVAIETDPERSSPELGGRPRVLGQSDAEQMLAHLTADLGNVLGGISNCHLLSAGALFDQCQILRPELPVFEALAGLLNNDGSGAVTPGQTALGGVDGIISDSVLMPDPEIPPAMLLLLPLVISGPEQQIRELAEEMEHRFLGEGQVSAHTASWLEAAFGLGISHARYMTLTDLNAMFRMQLEHFGYLPLWELTDAAVSGLGKDLEMVTDNGMRLEWHDDSVWIEYQTFDFWANHGGGLMCEDARLGEQYANWCRELRRYTSTLVAHHIPVSFYLPEQCLGKISEHYLFEDTEYSEINGTPAAITEHSHEELGIVAITVKTPSNLRNYYPLTPRGLNEIHELIQDLELDGRGMAFPGRVRFSTSGRRLRPGVIEA